MISKPLLKQSIKANGLTWLLVTVITAFMLGIIISVLGSINSNEIRDSLKTSFTKSEIEAQLKAGAIDGFTTVYETIEELYPTVKLTYDQVDELTKKSITVYNQLNELGIPNPKETAIETIVANVPDEQKEFATYIITQVLTAYESGTLGTDTAQFQFVSHAVIDLIINGMEEEVSEETRSVIERISQLIIDIYAKNKELTNENMQTIARIYIENSFYDSLGVSNEASQEMLDSLGYTSMYELLEAYDYTKTSIVALISSGIIQYTSYINSGIESAEAKDKSTQSLLSQMPEEVGDSLIELGDLNINHLVIGTIFYKIAGLLLPIVYTITTANNLIAGQVDKGSMAYVLSTPTKRKKVMITQMVYLIGSLIAMYIVIGITSFITSLIAREGEFEISYKELLMLNVGALITMIAISGICFLASAWFNRVKYSMGIGGGISMFFLVSTILGLFGSDTIPEALRIKAMNFFNYTTIITLFDAEKILNGETYIFGLLILLGIALVTYTIGIIKFDKKDLPL